MYTGNLRAPRNRSANAILTTRNKYFLRIFLFFAKITMVSKFPTTTRINVSVKALHNAMPSPWVPSYASFASFRRLTLAEVDEDVLVILRWFWGNNEEARLQQMLCSFLLFTDQLRMQTLHCDTLLMTETADVLFSLLISLGRVPLIKRRLFKTLLISVRCQTWSLPIKLFKCSPQEKRKPAIHWGGVQFIIKIEETLNSSSKVGRSHLKLVLMTSPG